MFLHLFFSRSHFWYGHFAYATYCTRASKFEFHYIRMYICAYLFNAEVVSLCPWFSMRHIFFRVRVYSERKKKKKSIELHIWSEWRKWRKWKKLNNKTVVLNILFFISCLTHFNRMEILCSMSSHFSFVVIIIIVCRRRRGGGSRRCCRRRQCSDEHMMLCYVIGVSYDGFGWRC